MRGLQRTPPPGQLLPGRAARFAPEADSSLLGARCLSGTGHTTRPEIAAPWACVALGCPWVAPSMLGPEAPGVDMRIELSCDHRGMAEELRNGKDVSAADRKSVV